MKKILLSLLFCFFGATTFAQGVLYIRNSSPRKVRMQIQAAPNGSATTATTLTATTAITIPPGTLVTPTVYTLTNFNNTAPAAFTSQFTQWSRLINGTGATLLTKAVTQSTYGPTPKWGQIKYDVINATTNVVIGSGGVGSTFFNTYPQQNPNPNGPTPGSPVTQGTFSANWINIGVDTIVDFTGN
jgi:hypothetical protein